jgi:hypothetical protein
MGLISQLANSAWRDSFTLGQPSSGVNDPVKAQIRAVLAQVDASISDLALFATIGIIEPNLAALNANLVPAAGTGAIVWDDSTAANNGIYVKNGGTGTGSWTNTGITLPSSFAAILTELEAAVPWYTATWCQVSQLKAQLVADGTFQIVLNVIPGSPANAVNQQWTGGAIMTSTGPLAVAVGAALSLSSGALAALIGAAATQAI